MDVDSLLKKMRLEIDDLQFSVHSEPSEEHPIYYKKVKETTCSKDGILISKK